MNLDRLNQTVAEVVKFATQLPPGVGLLTRPDGLPLSPILGPDDQIWYWVIYLEKSGSGPRPALVSQAMNEEGIAELGAGWKVGRVKVDPMLITQPDFVVEALRIMADKLGQRDRATEN